MQSSLAKKGKYIAIAAIREKRDESFFPPFEKRYVYISQRSLYLYIVALLDFFLLLFSSTSIYPHHPFFFLCTYTSYIAAAAPHTHTQKKKRDEVAKGNKNTLLFLLFLPGDP
jgi:hypothetical protein